MKVARKLVVIFYADISGYSRLTGVDEEGTHRRAMETLDGATREISSVGGTVLRYAGDAILAIFQSAVHAVDAAASIQAEIQKRNQGFAKKEQIQIRIGINLGDVIEDRGEVYGDGVNIAARLESMAPPGGICISKQVAEQIARKTNVSFASCGMHSLKNIPDPIEVWVWPKEHAKNMHSLKAHRRRNLIFASVAATLAVAALFSYNYLRGNDALPSGPRIVVVPFASIGNEEGQSFFSDGLTKDVSAQLAKFSNLFVIAQTSTAKYRDNPDCEQIRNDLDADYILTGAARRSNDRIWITTAFTDASNCRQLDSPGPFDRDLSMTDLLNIQMEISSKIASQIGSADAPLFNTEVQQSVRNKAPDNLRAYECVLLSYWFYENFAPERHRKARACLEHAVETDPDYSLAWSRLAFSYMESQKYAIDTPPNWAELSRQSATTALGIDPDNSDAHYAMAILTQMLGEGATIFQSFADRAIALNPNDAFVLADLGTWMAYTGKWERGKEWVSRAKLLNPNHQSWWDWIWLLHHYVKSEYAEARDVALKINLPNNYVIQAALCATYGMLGDQKKAEKALAHLLEIRPDFADDPRAPYRTRHFQPELIEGLMEGLRKAGLDVPPKKS